MRTFGKTQVGKKFTLGNEIFERIGGGLKYKKFVNSEKRSKGKFQDKPVKRL